MEIIFIIGVSLSFFLAFLVFDKKNKSKADYVLFSWMILIGLHLLNYYLQTTGISYRYPHLLGIGIAFPMLQGPVMFVYVLLMINKNDRFIPIYWLNALPFVLFTLVFIFDFYILSAAEKLAYYELKNIAPTPRLVVMTLPNIILGPIYVILSLMMLRKHKKNIVDNFSYTEKITLNWLMYVIGGLGFVWLTVVLSNVVFSFSALSYSVHDHIIYISATIAIFFLGYFGIKQKAIYDSNPDLVELKYSESTEEMKNNERYRKSGLKKEDAEEYLKKLHDYFENEKPFLDGKLSLKEVSEYLEISVNHLSQIVNEQLGVSFFDFVNNYRVQEIKSHMSDSTNEKYTILALAYDSGFNSKSGFNNIFKKFTGLTPSQYLKQEVA